MRYGDGSGEDIIQFRSKCCRKWACSSLLVFIFWIYLVTQCAIGNMYYPKLMRIGRGSSTLTYFQKMIVSVVQFLTNTLQKYAPTDNGKKRDESIVRILPFWDEERQYTVPRLSSSGETIGKIRYPHCAVKVIQIPQNLNGPGTLKNHCTRIKADKVRAIQLAEPSCLNNCTGPLTALGNTIEFDSTGPIIFDQLYYHFQWYWTKNISFYTLPISVVRDHYTLNVYFINVMVRD